MKSAHGAVFIEKGDRINTSSLAAYYHSLASSSINYYSVTIHHQMAASLYMSLLSNMDPNDSTLVFSLNQLMTIMRIYGEYCVEFYREGVCEWFDSFGISVFQFHRPILITKLPWYRKHWRILSMLLYMGRMLF